jgi:hypothetical protein
MNRRRNLKYLVLLGIVLSLAGVLWAQRGPDKVLVVNGKAIESPVRQIDGHSYVDIETLAQITNGVIAVQPDRIVLTIRPAASSTPPPAPPVPASPPPPAVGLSKAFSREAIDVLAEMREWRGAIGATRSYNVPFTGTWPQEYHDRAEANLQHVSVAASTPADQDALQLLRNEFDNLSNWAGTLIAERQALNATKSVDPNVTQNDQILAKISTCSSFLSGMLVSGEFADSPSCH